MIPFNSFEEFQETYKRYEDIYLLQLCVENIYKRKHWYSLRKTYNKTIHYYKLIPVSVKRLCYDIEQVDVQIINSDFYYVDRVCPDRLYHFKIEDYI